MHYVFLDPDKEINSADFEFIKTFLASTNRSKIGWHYIVDLTWIYSHAKRWPKNYRILDAGGGLGPTQFLLAELGFDVTNLDLILRQPAKHVQNRYKIDFSVVESFKKTDYIEHLNSASTNSRLMKSLKNTISGSVLYQTIAARQFSAAHNQWRSQSDITAHIGSINWIQANLCSVPEISSNSYDAVVSLSAIEHIPAKNLTAAWNEVIRLSKPDAEFAITTSATERKKSWYHEPSNGNCFSEGDLNAIFGGSRDENSAPADVMLDKYRDCAYLKKNLANFYKKSGENGMPWGVWDPKYFPVGMYR